MTVFLTRTAIIRFQLISSLKPKGIYVRPEVNMAQMFKPIVLGAMDFKETAQKIGERRAQTLKDLHFLKELLEEGK